MRVRLMVAVMVFLGTLTTVAVTATATPQAGTLSCDDVAHYITAAHTGSSCTQLSPTASQLWSDTLNGDSSYPIIAGGKVFVTTTSSAGGSLYALDASTGAILWGPVILGGTYGYFPLAYDNGRLFVSNFDGTVVAFDPGSGSQLWATRTSDFAGEPVATGGVVYLQGSGPVSAISEATGQIEWTSSGLDGDASAVAVDSTGVYVNGGCSQFRLSLLTGSPVWADNNGCDGGGGGASFVSDGLYYAVTGDEILGASDGTDRGTFSGTPAFDAGNVFLATGDILSSDVASSLNPRFSTTLPSAIIDGPVIADGIVYVATANSSIYELTTATGQIVSTKSLPAPPGGGGTPSDLGVGDGLLVAPAGATVTAFGYPTPPRAPCTRTITSKVRGSIGASTGMTCINGATIEGSVSVGPGASLSMIDSRVIGPVVANAAAAVTLCGNAIAGAVEVFGSSGLVVIGSDGSVAPSCQGNTVTVPVILGWFGSSYANAAGIVLDGNTLMAPVAVENNSDPSGGITQIDANRVSGALLCGANVPVPVNFGAANHVTGKSYSQCLGL